MDAQAARSARRGWIDPSTETVTIGPAASPQHFTCAGLPDITRAYLVALGLKTALLAYRDAAATYARLKRGEIPEPRQPQPPRQSKRRTALAACLAMAKARQDAKPGTKKRELELMAQDNMPAMYAHVATLSKDTVRRLCARDDVCETYRTMYGHGTDSNQLSLLALAGVVDPPMELPHEQGETAREDAQGMERGAVRGDRGRCDQPDPAAVS
jgi:hypothetical protein